MSLLSTEANFNTACWWPIPIQRVDFSPILPPLLRLCFCHPLVPTTAPSRSSYPHPEWQNLLHLCSALSHFFTHLSVTLDQVKPVVQAHWGLQPLYFYVLVYLSDSSLFYFLVCEAQSHSESLHWYPHKHPLQVLTSVLWTTCLSRAHLQLDLSAIHSLPAPAKGLPIAWLLIPWQMLLLSPSGTIWLPPFMLLIFTPSYFAQWLINIFSSFEFLITLLYLDPQHLFSFQIFPGKNSAPPHTPLVYLQSLPFLPPLLLRVDVFLLSQAVPPTPSHPP